jgi:cyclic lactone autoinducer peptide
MGGGLILKIAKGLIQKFASIVAALVFIVAVASVSATCFFVAYQPDVPEALR